jgi:hypothetical protein
MSIDKDILCLNCKHEAHLGLVCAALEDDGICECEDPEPRPNDRLERMINDPNYFKDAQERHRKEIIAERKAKATRLRTEKPPVFWEWFILAAFVLGNVAVWYWWTPWIP